MQNQTSKIRYQLSLLSILFLGCSSKMATIEFYEAEDNKIQILFLNCACSHKGYYVIDNNEIFWFIPEHKSVQLLGTIKESSSKAITYLSTDEKKYKITKSKNGLNFYGPKGDFSLVLSPTTKELRGKYENIKRNAKTKN